MGGLDLLSWLGVIKEQTSSQQDGALQLSKVSQLPADLWPHMANLGAHLGAHGFVWDIGVVLLQPCTWPCVCFPGMCGQNFL